MHSCNIQGTCAHVQSSCWHSSIIHVTFKTWRGFLPIPANLGEPSDLLGRCLQPWKRLQFLRRKNMGRLNGWSGRRWSLSQCKLLSARLVSTAGYQVLLLFFSYDTVARPYPTQNLCVMWENVLVITSCSHWHMTYVCKHFPNRLTSCTFAAISASKRLPHSWNLNK